MPRVPTTKRESTTVSQSNEQNLLRQISECVQRGQTGGAASAVGVQAAAGGPGVVELIEQALAAKKSAKVILEEGLLRGMNVIGQQFSAGEVFIPEVLIAARAMKAGLAVLKPCFAEEAIPSRGVFIIGTVRGDLHDIGKNIVAVILEGAGWEMMDLGTNCPPDRFLEAMAENPACAVGLSALLTTTMVNMGEAVKTIREQSPETVVLVGGAPVTADFAREIGAHGCAADPTEAIALLDELAPER